MQGGRVSAHHFYLTSTMVAGDVRLVSCVIVTDAEASAKPHSLSVLETSAILQFVNRDADLRLVTSAERNSKN